MSLSNWAQSCECVPQSLSDMVAARRVAGIARKSRKRLRRHAPFILVTVNLVTVTSDKIVSVCSFHFPYPMMLYGNL